MLLPAFAMEGQHVAVAVRHEGSSDRSLVSVPGQSPHDAELIPELAIRNSTDEPYHMA